MKPIVLITDFGISSPYIAEMKGAMLTICQNVQFVDGTHAVPPQDVAQGAIVLEQLVPAFPQGSLFVTVVDPGVGTNRHILLVEWKGRVLIAPDNGLLTTFIDGSNVRSIDQPKYWRESVSSTFHGRDIMGPVAVHLANGVSTSDVASVAKFKPVVLHKPQPTTETNSIVGEVVCVDTFGNLISNIPAREVLARTNGIVEFQGLQLKICQTYGMAARHSPLALVSSGGFLEIAIHGGNAARHLDAQNGDRICFRWE